MIALMLIALQDIDSKGSLRECARNQSMLVKAMYNYSITQVEPEGSFPLATGPDFWGLLKEEVEGYAVLQCPVTGRRYAGPRSNANLFGAGEPIGLCEHGTKVVWVAKSGDVHTTDRDSKGHLRALETTSFGYGWRGAGTTWTLKPLRDGGKPMRIEVKKMVEIGRTPGVIVEISGGPLDQPITEELYHTDRGILRYVAAKIPPADLEARLKQIASDDAGEREAATEELAKLYPTCRDSIDAALTGDDPELKARLGVIRSRSVEHAAVYVAYPLQGDAVEIRAGDRAHRGVRMRMDDTEFVWSDEHNMFIGFKRGDGEWVLESYTPR